jgi:hypothetical protein
MRWPIAFEKIPDREWDCCSTHNPCSVRFRDNNVWGRVTKILLALAVFHFGCGCVNTANTQERPNRLPEEQILGPGEICLPDETILAELGFEFDALLG